MDEKKKILIVEDEKDISEILAYNIQRQGYEVDTAYDGETGLSKALGGNFDLILLDVMLPKMDGFEICKRVREVKETPIIILTAREEENDKIMGLDLGAERRPGVGRPAGPGEPRVEPGAAHAEDPGHEPDGEGSLLRLHQPVALGYPRLAAKKVAAF